MCTTLLINDSESPDEFALILGFDLGVTDHKVKAILPVLEYAMKVIEKRPKEIRFVVIDDFEYDVKKISMANELSMNFPTIEVIVVGKKKYERGDTPNLHSFKNLRAAALYIKQTLEEKTQ